MSAGRGRRRRGAPLLAAASIAAGVAGCASPRTSAPAPADPPPGHALERIALPDARHGQRAEVLPDGRVLVFGGFVRGDASPGRGAHATWILEPALGAWRRTGDLAVPLAFHGSAVHAGTLYAVGGGRVQRFDAATETWLVVVADERIPASHLGAAAVDGRLYAVGFGAAVVDLATFDVSALPTPPDHDPRDHLAHVVALGGRLHLVGGLGGEDSQLRTRHVVFDGATWSRAADAPFPVDAKFGTCVAYAGALHVLGTDGNARYDLASDTWEPLPPSPWSGHRAMAAAFVDGGRLFLLGGLGNGRAHGIDVLDLDAGVWIVPAGDREGDPEGDPEGARSGPGTGR